MAVNFLDIKYSFKDLRYLISRLDYGVYSFGNLRVEIVNEYYKLFVKFEGEIHTMSEFIETFGIQEILKTKELEKYVMELIDNS